MAETTSWEQAEYLCNHYVCSDCWDVLQSEGLEENVYRLFCETKDCTTPGFVSHKSIDYRQRINEEQLYLAKRALRAVSPWLKKPIDVKKILDELGFHRNCADVGANGRREDMLCARQVLIR